MSTDKDTIIINNRIHAKCPKCKNYKDANTQEGKSFDCGIGVVLAGGYNGYYDPFHRDEQVYLELCHECSVELLKYLEVYDNELFIGGHPSLIDGDFCCNNSWVAIYDDNKKWIGHKTPYNQVMH